MQRTIGSCSQHMRYALYQLHAASNARKEKQNFISQYLGAKNIPALLRQRILDFYSFSGFDNDNQHLTELPRPLRAQLDLVLNR
jgi:hypothetical protein